MDYRTYRLQDTAQTRTGYETGRLRDHVKRFELTFKDRLFSGADPVAILSFLASVVDECDILELSEAQAYLLIPYLLSGSAKTDYLAARRSGRSYEGGVACWPEAIQYFLSTYCSAIRTDMHTCTI